MGYDSNVPNIAKYIVNQIDGTVVKVFGVNESSFGRGYLDSYNLSILSDTSLNHLYVIQSINQGGSNGWKTTLVIFNLLTGAYKRAKTLLTTTTTTQGNNNFGLDNEGNPIVRIGDFLNGEIHKLSHETLSTIYSMQGRIIGRSGKDLWFANIKNKLGKIDVYGNVLSSSSAEAPTRIANSNSQDYVYFLTELPDNRNKYYQINSQIKI